MGWVVGLWLLAGTGLAQRGDAARTERLCPWEMRDVSGDPVCFLSTESFVGLGRYRDDGVTQWEFSGSDAEVDRQITRIVRVWRAVLVGARNGFLVARNREHFFILTRRSDGASILQIPRAHPGAEAYRDL